MEGRLHEVRSDSRGVRRGFLLGSASPSVVDTLARRRRSTLRRGLAGPGSRAVLAIRDDPKCRDRGGRNLVVRRDDPANRSASGEYLACCSASRIKPTSTWSSEIARRHSTRVRSKRARSTEIVSTQFHGEQVLNLRYFFAWLSLAIALVSPSPAARADVRGPLVGRASIVDGDTLEIHGQRIRLWGIDAPESDQTCRRANGAIWRCGAQAANALSGFVGERTVSCTRKGRSYERVVARCDVGGIDLGTWAVSNGWALEFERYSRGFYRDVQSVAQSAGAGIHAGSFIAPWEFRASKRAARRSSAPPYSVKSPR